jgi:hypothetical protein
MIMRQSNFIPSKCGRPISVLKRDDGWHVYLDHVLLQNTVFATEGYARRWLLKQINQRRVPGHRHTLAA